MIKIPFHKINYNQAEYKTVQRVLKSGWLTMGPKSRTLEKLFKKKIGGNNQTNALVVSSCTSALHLSLIALGIGKGDEVICPALTFVADANAIKYTGAKPVFCDVESTSNLNISAEDIEKKITKKTKLIILVHYAGYPCNLKKIKKIAKKRKIKILEDACHSLFSSIKNKKLGTFGDLSVFSFYSNKNITSGEGGMVFGKNKYIKKIKILRNHGIMRNNFSVKKFNSNYDVVNLGYNYRLNEISCSILIEQLKKIDIFNSKRKKLALYYKSQINKFFDKIVIPFENFIGGEYSYHIFPIILPNKINRDKFIKYLNKKKIETTIHYKPITEFKYYKQNIKFKNLDKCSKRLVSLPIYPSLKKSEINYIIKSVKKFLT